MSSTAFEGKFIEFLDGAIQRSKRSADRAMVQFVVLRLMLVVASASLPALITIAGQNWSSVVAVLVAALTGLDTQFRWGEEWRHFRSTQLSLERMKRDYDRRQSALDEKRPIGKITTQAEVLISSIRMSKNFFRANLIDSSNSESPSGGNRRAMRHEPARPDQLAHSAGACRCRQRARVGGCARRAASATRPCHHNLRGIPHRLSRRPFRDRQCERSRSFPIAKQ